MKFRVDLIGKSSTAWIDTVMSDFDTFLQDHANCERKASAMAMSFIAKFPDRVEIIPDLLDTAIEELEHFKAVYKIMERRQVLLPSKIGQDSYVKQLVDQCRSGKMDRFMDRLLLASVIECRGAERFKLISEALEDIELKDFYKNLWISEVKHGNIFVKMTINYFDSDSVYKRLDELNVLEAEVLDSLPLKAALH
ncbi:MAG: tRNA-(ms[2]io[6]A)-hydroxylase [Thermodesulfobacteriota bacterium]